MTDREQPVRVLVLVPYSERATWKAIIQTLEGIGISPVCEGAAGWVEVCVSPEAYEPALAALKNASFLVGKRLQWF